MVDTVPVVDIPRTFGALLIGGLVAAAFSGIVSLQSFAYFKNYPGDSFTTKLLVAIVWFFDFVHTIFVGVSLWDYLIVHFGNRGRIDFISWSLPLTIANTAVLTFLVHCFFVHRIYKLSKGNRYFASFLAFIACLRLGFACLTTVKMITLKSLGAFVAGYTWSFTLGLATSSLLDVLVTASLCFMLMTSRKKSSTINHILDMLVIYAFENGALTCAATVVSMICWLTMPTNLIFMGLHFVISKFYANSLLATLHTRKTLNQAQAQQSQYTSGDRPVPVHFPESLNANRRFSRRADLGRSVALEITVEESMIRTFDSTKSIPQVTPYNKESDEEHN